MLCRGRVASYSDDKETEQNAVLVLAVSTLAFQAESTSSNLVYCFGTNVTQVAVTPPKTFGSRSELS